MTSLAFEHLAAHEQRMTFMHNLPGLVQMDIIARYSAPQSSGTMGWLKRTAFQLFAAIALALVGTSVKDSGKR